MCGDSPKYALRKALVVTRSSTILDSVVEVNIGRTTNAYKDLRRSYKVPYLLTPALFTLVNAVPAMQQLHSIHLNNLILSRMYLYTILSSPYLIHLILRAVQMPKMSAFPHANLRKLTLTAMTSWESVQPLISQLATSLEYLSLQGCEFRALPQIQLPSFPRLRELHLHQLYNARIFPDNSRLNELLRLGSQLTHLLLTGQFDSEPITACQNNLQHLSVSDGMLSDQIIGTVPFPRLMHLSIRILRFSYAVKNPLERSLFIRDHFPGITSLDLHIPWFFRNNAVAIARSQHNVHTLKLANEAEVGIEYEEDVRICFCCQVRTPHDELHQAMSPMALRTLKLEVTQFHRGLEGSATRCTRWIYNDIIPSATGLGGPGLTSISMSVSKPKSGSIAREQVLSRQWVKVADDDWQIVE